MITIQLPNPSPYFYGSGMATKVLGPSLPEPVIPNENDTCICDFITCGYLERIFAHPVDNDFWKNDKNEFLFKRLVPVDTVDMELHKDGVKVADLNNNALGNYFPLFPAPASAEQQLYKGYLVDWQSVLLAHGVGFYTVVAELNILGNQSTFTSRQFHLLVYSDLNAHETVRIESTQNGNIIGGQFDFTDLDWYQSMRLPGIFGKPTPIYEEDRYITSNPNRKKKQIQDTMGREWTLNTKKISWEISEKLIYNNMLANEILLTDYNIYAESIWRRVGVFPNEIEKQELSASMPDKIYNITFVDNRDIFKKRNF